MAKEIPYFKFYIDDWTNGDVTLEDYHLQGLFINICAYYWSKKCDLSLINTKKKFRGFEADIDQLIACNCIKINGENISISFLNEQLDSKEVQSAINRNNGALGGRPKKEKTEEKPNGLFLQNRNITNIKKRREENIKEDINVVDIVELALPTSTQVDNVMVRCKKFVEFFNKQKQSKYQATEKVVKSFKKAIKNYKPEELMKVISAALSDPRHRETNFQFVTPEFVLRTEIIERYLNITVFKQSTVATR